MITLSPLNILFFQLLLTNDTLLNTQNSCKYMFVIYKIRLIFTYDNPNRSSTQRPPL